MNAKKINVLYKPNPPSTYIMKHVFLMFVFLILNSCTNSTYNLNTPFFKGTFLKVEKIIRISACNPKNLNHCITKMYGSSASSFIVEHKGEYSYLLTSAHVCHMDFGLIARLPKFRADIEFYGITLDMKKHDFEILKMNKESDLCLVRTKRIELPAYKVSENSPKIGDPVYNIAAPVGIYEKDMVPLFAGIYSGDAYGRSVFSIPAVGGSSGSPILNGRGEVIGVISATITDFKHLVISSPLKAIKEIIKDGLQ